jgi:hypothetical protein
MASYIVQPKAVQLKMTEETLGFLVDKQPQQCKEQTSDISIEALVCPHACSENGIGDLGPCLIVVS